MKNHLRIMVVFLFCFFLSGCYTNQFIQRIKTLPSGRYAESVRLVDERIKEAGVARSSDLIELCYSLSQTKQYKRLFACLDQLEDSISKGDKKGSDSINDDVSVLLWPYHDISAMPYLIRAQAQIELGDYSSAIAIARKAYAIGDSSKNLNYLMGSWPQRIKMQALGLISLAYALQGKHEEAKNFQAQIEEMYVGISVPNQKEKKNILARTHMALGNYERILSDRNAILEGLMIYHVLRYSNLPYQFMIKKALFETGSIAEAKRGYDELLTKPGIQQSGEIYWSILFDRGKIAEKEQQIKEAITFYTRAVDTIELQRSTIHTEASKIGFVGDKQAVYHHLIRALYQDRQYEKAFEYVERAKARALVDTLAAKKDFAMKGGDEQGIKTILAMNESIEEEAMLQDPSLDKDRTRSIQIKIRQDMKDKAPELASLVTVTSQPLSELQSLIAPEEALIEYYYRDGDMYAFVLGNGTLQTVKLNAEGLAEDIQAFRKHIDTPQSARFMEASQKLYNRIFRPLEERLNKRHLIIVAHGALHYLPMNALHDGNGYLIDRYGMRMMPSAGAMKYLSEGKTSRQDGVLIFGNPDLGDPKYDLEHAQQEATEIANIRPKSRMFIRKEATEATFRHYAKDYNYIHFATHGQFIPETPLKSAILLSPDAKYNGMLTVDKLYSLHLDADLVTLSACETGLSKITNGDELVGLTRGFLYAGSRSIVASLWKVDDLATAQLMKRFYAELAQSNKRDALRTAQLETKKKYPHPYYWASFQLTGSAQ